MDAQTADMITVYAISVERMNGKEMALPALSELARKRQDQNAERAALGYRSETCLRGRRVRLLGGCRFRGLFPGPAEFGAVNPYTMHDHGQPACQGHDRLFHPAAPGDLQSPGSRPGR
jgi:hypothetical protein